MSAGDRLIRPRCGRPVKRYDKPGRDDPEPVCWRPEGHPGDKHLSRWAYLKELERSRHARKKPWQRKQDPA